jgi:hypothetical protein
MSALKFIGLAVSAVALGVLSSSFAFSHIGAGASRVAGSGPQGWMALITESRMTEDEMPAGIRHIVRRH